MTRRGPAFFAPRGRSSLERLVRGLLLVGVFALAVAAFSHYFNEMAEQMAARGTVSDALGVLTASDKTWILDQAAVLKRRFGLDLVVRVGGPDRPLPGNEARRLVVFYDPDCRRGRVSVPPLVASALPKGFVGDLGREHLDAACREGRAREGVLAVIGLVTTTLGEAASRGQGEGS